MTTHQTPEVRLTFLEQDMHTLKTRLDVLEAKVDKGFSSLEARFDTLEAWLRERL